MPQLRFPFRRQHALPLLLFADETLYQRKERLPDIQGKEIKTSPERARFHAYRLFRSSKSTGFPADAPAKMLE